MNARPRSCQRAVAVALTVSVLIAVAMMSSASAEDDHHPRVFPRDSSPYGNTYGEWSAQWWQWITAIPADINPNIDPNGQHCGEGQAGPVWFLAGGFPGFPVGTRSCTVPAGKALLFPLPNTLYGAGAGDCTPTVPDVPCNLTALRQAAAVDIDSRVLPRVEIDNLKIHNLRDFRVQSPVMTLTYPEDNVVQLVLTSLIVPAGTHTPNVSDGYFLLIAPLSRGTHTIRLNGDLAYRLTIP